MNYKNRLEAVNKKLNSAISKRENKIASVEKELDAERTIIEDLKATMNSALDAEDSAGYIKAKTDISYHTEVFNALQEIIDKCMESPYLGADDVEALKGDLVGIHEELLTANYKRLGKALDDFIKAAEAMCEELNEDTEVALTLRRVSMGKNASAVMPKYGAKPYGTERGEVEWVLEAIRKSDVYRRILAN